MGALTPIQIQPTDQASMVVAVVLAVQLGHWLLGKLATDDLADRSEPILVIAWSILLTAAWFLSTGHVFTLADVYPMVLLNLTLMAAAAGVFGFVRTQVQNQGLALRRREDAERLAVRAPRQP